jgi:hypothetical protein
MHQALFISQVKTTISTPRATVNLRVHRAEIESQNEGNLSFAVVNASLDQEARQRLGWFFTDFDQLQLIYFTPIEAETPSKLKLQHLQLALRGWSSPYLQKLKTILINFKQLVDFMKKR